MASVKIYQGADGGTHVYINGTELKRVRSVKYDHEAAAIPTFTFETFDRPDIFLKDAYVNLCVIPDSLSIACMIIREAYRADESFREAFHAGIKDMLLHRSPDWSIDEFAERIGDRIIG